MAVDTMKERILDTARWGKGLLDTLSQATLFGLPIDWLFHLVFAAAITWIASVFLARRRVIQLGIGMIMAKELFDVFAKTRVEYIRAPEADIALDLASGLIGLALGLWLARRRSIRFGGRR